MTVIKYEESGLNGKILRAVTEMGFETMTPIQAEAMPVLMEGKDVIGQAQTGTGKTAAFGIPLLQKINPEVKNVQAIVLCPTRELAIQAAEEMRKFAKFLHGIKILPVYGGQDIKGQIRALKGGTQVVVGTPGRVMDHMRRHTLKMNDISMVVLDEADEMLNMGFREDMETILREVPDGHQTALFSATMPQAILDITNEFQKDAVLVKMPAKELTVSLIKQYYVVCKNDYKTEVIRRLKENYHLKRSLIFCNTKKMVDDLSASLKKLGYQAEGLHGDLTQKQRDFVMNRFRNGSLEFLIATDVAARGIDVDDLEAVFNYDVPQDTEYYVHRIGRTGRAGKEGLSFTLINGREMGKIREIERICKTTIAQHPIPASKEMLHAKADAVLKEAETCLKERNISEIRLFLTEKMAETGMDSFELAAALLQMQLGNTDMIADELIQDTVREYGRRNPRGNRTERRGHGGSSRGGFKDFKGAKEHPDGSYRKNGHRPQDSMSRQERPGHTRIRVRNSGAKAVYENSNSRNLAAAGNGKRRQNRAG